MLDLRVVLAQVRNPLNIGAAARAMSNFGFTDLVLVNAYRVAAEEAKSAVHADAVMANARDCATMAEALAGCTLVAGTSSIGKRDLQMPLFRLEEAARRIKRHNGKVALLFGSEKFGLSNEEMSHCHFLLRIPARPEHGSMNLGQAVSICLYELIRNGRAVAPKPLPPKEADAADVDRLTGYLLHALDESGYLKPPTTEAMRLKVRRLVLRMKLSSHDAVQLQGMMRQIVWKLGRGAF